MHFFLGDFDGGGLKPKGTLFLQVCDTIAATGPRASNAPVSAIKRAPDGYDFALAGEQDLSGLQGADALAQSSL